MLDVKDRKGMKKIVRPYQIIIQPPGPRTDTCEVEITFRSTWFNGMRARIRDGQVMGFRRNPFRPIEQEPTEWLTHPDLGELGKGADGIWHGITRCEPFCEFLNVAIDRAEFRDDPDEFGPIESTLAWDIARGEFELKVYASAAPATAQVRSWQSFRRHEAAYADRVVASIFEDYCRSLEPRRAAWDRSYIEDRLPTLRSPAGLRELLELESVNLLPARGSGKADIGFEFSSAWQTRVGVRWRDDRVVAIGGAEAARPARSRRKVRTKR